MITLHMRNVPANQEAPLTVGHALKTIQESAVDNPSENLSHILTECTSYSLIRDRMIPEFANLCEYQSQSLVIYFVTKIILNPTSLNLQSMISVSDPNVGLFFQLAKDYCFSIHNTRMSILKH